ncbi:hypothetical protein CHS0354_014846 [Potamilus streckersoni]|uniref:Uncharacterized protein n=1 Tax=Potamilus streckersoni TaxID=2493646 RepID=A0AAE0RVM2_9BIVA|nr:hypothetical protein CHS0354_014846 [Potamilus streckersoni]
MPTTHSGEGSQPIRETRTKYTDTTQPGNMKQNTHGGSKRGRRKTKTNRNLLPEKRNQKNKPRITQISPTRTKARKTYDCTTLVTTEREDQRKEQHGLLDERTGGGCATRGRYQHGGRVPRSINYHTESFCRAIENINFQAPSRLDGDLQLYKHLAGGVAFSWGWLGCVPGYEDCGSRCGQKVSKDTTRQLLSEGNLQNQSDEDETTTTYETKPQSKTNQDNETPKGQNPNKSNPYITIKYKFDAVTHPTTKYAKDMEETSSQPP